MADVRLTLHGLTDEDAQRIANQLSAEWVRLDPARAYTAATVQVVREDQLAQEATDRLILERLRAIHADMHL